MALTIENGTGVAGADSYVTLIEARAYAAKRGLTLPASPAGDTALEQLLTKAMDYIEWFRSRYQGLKTTATQPLQFPRTGVILDGYELASDVIPQILKDAQCQLAVDANSTDLMPNGLGKEVVKEKVDVVEVQYAESGVTNAQPDFTKAQALLEPLFEIGKSGFTLTSERV